MPTIEIDAFSYNLKASAKIHLFDMVMKYDDGFCPTNVIEYIRSLADSMDTLAL